MSVLIVRLVDFVINPSNPVDLTGIPEEEAGPLIAESFRSITDSVEVILKDGIATIILPDEVMEDSPEAADFCRKGVQAAERGQYRQAIDLFHKVLKLQPFNVEARRNLGMSHLECGEVEQAKDCVAQALRVKPDDTWSLVLLGNILNKHERNLETAEPYYAKAYEISPDDPWVLTNYGALLAERGLYNEAREKMDRALASTPWYPNAHFGKALCFLQEGRPDLGMQCLDELFDGPQSKDRRSTLVCDEARRMYLKLSDSLASLKHEETDALIEERRIEIEGLTGYPIVVERDDSIEGISAVTQIAWKHDRDHHLLRYRHRSGVVQPHLIAHELEHILLEQEARQAGRNRFFIVSQKTREFAIKSMSGYIHQLNRMGYGEKGISEVVKQLIEGICGQVFNIPLDMVIEERIHNSFDFLRPYQLVWLHTMNLENLATFRNPEVRKLSPPRIYSGSITLNCLFALFTDALYEGRTNLAAAYADSEFYQPAKKLLQLYDAQKSRIRPGGEYDLVDQYAQALKLEKWYEWKPDVLPRTERPKAGRQPQGTTSPELLDEKTPASVMCCLAALRRFERLDEEEVRAIAFEISVLGTKGLDHASSERQYTLNSCPGESFTGLQLMCLMFVGFHILDPSLDTGIDLKDAYLEAERLHKATHN